MPKTFVRNILSNPPYQDYYHDRNNTHLLL